MNILLIEKPFTKDWLFWVWAIGTLIGLQQVLSKSYVYGFSTVHTIVAFTIDALVVVPVAWLAYVLPLGLIRALVRAVRTRRVK